MKERAALGLPGFMDGVDVSVCQQLIDYEKVRDAGFRFAFVKGSEGSGYIDPCAAKHIAGFMNVGIYVSVYGFARPGNGNPEAQADMLVKSMGDVWLPRPMLDIESAPNIMTAQELVTFSERFLDRLDTHGAADGVLYSYTSFLARMQPALASSARLARAALSLAQYASLEFAWAPTTPKDLAWAKAPAPWPEWVFWQYSGDKGFRVPGIDVDCDRNLFRGTEHDLRAFFGRGPSEDDVDTVPNLPGM